MPLSEEQTVALKNAATTVEFQVENPKKPGTKAWDRYEKYKDAVTISDATSKGAQWQDLSMDFEKGFMKCPSLARNMDTTISNKRAAIEGTPDREALARSKVPPVEPFSDASGSKVEVSAATIAAFRSMLREELADTEFKLTERFENTLGQMRADLLVERQARESLEQRVRQLEMKPHSPSQPLDDDVDRALAVVGGFGEKEAWEAEVVVKNALQNVDGLTEVYTTSSTPTVVFAQFASPVKMQRFVRTQKASKAMREAKLWAAENRSATERKRGKVASKIKKFLIEIDSITPRDIMVNYRSYKIAVRMKQKLVHVATVNEDGYVDWADVGCPASEEVRTAIQDIVDDME